jgi:hypothetical protein
MRIAGAITAANPVSIWAGGWTVEIDVSAGWLPDFKNCG